jgi:hypothetical protein
VPPARLPLARSSERTNPSPNIIVGMSRASHRNVGDLDILQRFQAAVRAATGSSDDVDGYMLAAAVLTRSAPAGMPHTRDPRTPKRPFAIEDAWERRYAEALARYDARWEC